MKIKVSESVLTQTTLCLNKFSCLSSAPTKICKVRGHLVKESLIIDCVADCDCKYRFSLGNWSICSCPTRKEIFDLYAV